MNWLDYFLKVPSKIPKVPYLVLVVQAGAQDEGLHLSDVCAAVLMFEYGFRGLGSGVFCSDDASGFRTVIAPVEHRAAVAQMGIEALFGCGMQIALICYASNTQTVPDAKLTVRNVQWAQRTRHFTTSLELASTYKATLATFGKSTRFNLGYYRRKLLAAFPCEFIEETRGLLTESEMEALNRTSLNPDTRAQARAQFRACWLPGGFLVGLRTLEGKWLSLIGGWRQGDLTVLYWQMNASGYEKLSIGTAMRSFFLEYEIARGTRSLMIYGGTPHSIQNAFLQEEVVDLFVRRRSWEASALQGLAKLFATPRWFMRQPNFLARAICQEELQWQSDRVSAAEVTSQATTAVQD